MFYSNTYFIVCDLMFKVTMYGQTFMVSTHSIKRILGMPPLTGQLSIFTLKVEALIIIELNSIPITLYAKFHPLSTHVSIVDFTKSAWIFAMFLSYSFYFFFLLYLDLSPYGLVHSRHSFWAVV